LLARRRRGGVQTPRRAQEAGLAGRETPHRPVRPGAVRHPGRRDDGAVPPRAPVGLQVRTRTSSGMTLGTPRSPTRASPATTTSIADVVAAVTWTACTHA